MSSHVTGSIVRRSFESCGLKSGGIRWRALAASTLLSVACGRPEPAVPTGVERDEICRGKRPVPEPTPAELRRSSYSLLDLGPELLANPPPLAQTPAPPVEPLIIPALPAVWNDEVPVPALPAAGSVLEHPAKSDLATKSELAAKPEPVLLSSGMELLTIDRSAPAYRARIPYYCTNGAPIASTLLICASETGRVTSVEIKKPSLPVLDRQLPEVVGRWEFRPYVLNGTARPFCFGLEYAVDFNTQ